MRIIFSGMLKHAAQLLQGFESNAGLDTDLRIIMDGLVKELPEVKLAHFSGNSILPQSVRPIKAQLSFENYLSPTMEIETNPEGGSIRMTGIPKGLYVMGTIWTVVKSAGLRSFAAKDDGQSSTVELLPGCSFESQPDFRYNTLEFLQNDSVLFDEKGIAIEVSLRDRRMGLLQITVNESKRRGKAYRFAHKLAKRLPKANIEYRLTGVCGGWEMIHQAWEWNGAKPYFVTVEHRKAALRLEKALKPYKKLIIPYFDANNLSEDSMLAGGIYANMEKLYEQGIRNPILLADFSIILGHVGTMALAASLMPGVAFSKDFDLEAKVTADVRKIADEVSQLDIGIKTSFWKRWIERPATLPEPFLVADLLMRMFHAFGKGKDDVVKQLHDEFDAMFPRPVPV